MGLGCVRGELRRLEDIPFDLAAPHVYDSDANEYVRRAVPTASGGKFDCFKCESKCDNADQLRWLSFTDVGQFVCQRCHLVEAALRFHHGGRVAIERLGGLRRMGTTSVKKSTEDDKVQETPFTDREVPGTPYGDEPRRTQQLVSELYKVAKSALECAGDTAILGVGLMPDVSKQDVMAFTRRKIRPVEVMMRFGASEHDIKVLARKKRRI